MSTPTGTMDSGADLGKGSGSVLFAGIMILIDGVLNVIYGIAAIDKSKFFVSGSEYILSNLNTWGWVALILGASRSSPPFRSGEAGRLGTGSAFSSPAWGRSLLCFRSRPTRSGRWRCSRSTS